MQYQIHVSAEMQECINKCTVCHEMCTKTLQHCLRKGERHATPEQIGPLLDCAQICRTTADFMLRGSILHVVCCQACAVVCDRSADACESITSDPQMTNCAEICAICARSCREMAGVRN